LALWAAENGAAEGRVSIAASAVALLTALVLAALSFLEHRRSATPSLLLGGYLFLTALVDVAQLRSLWRRDGLRDQAAAFTVAFAAKVGLFALEEVPKVSLVRGGKTEMPRESRGGLLYRTLFWWLNRLLATGYRALIGVDDLGSIDERFDSAQLLAALEKEWTKCLCLQPLEDWERTLTLRGR
jgi:ATP-binding cassette, subfamily C (CFTR/MRP), member 1